MKCKLIITAFLTCFVMFLYAQTKSIHSEIFKGKWALTRYTETFDGQTFNRPIAGVVNYEPVTDSTFKEMQQGDTISVYELKSDNTYTLYGRNGVTTGKWRTSDKDSMVTLYDNLTILKWKGPLPKSNTSIDLKLLSQGGLFLVLSSYDSGLKSMHKLYYKKTKAD